MMGRTAWPLASRRPLQEQAWGRAAGLIVELIVAVISRRGMPECFDLTHFDDVSRALLIDTYPQLMHHTPPGDHTH